MNLINQNFTKIFFVSVLGIFIISFFANENLFAQRKVYNPSDLTIEQIEERRLQTHPCAELKSRHWEAAVKQSILNEGLKVNGNQNDYDVIYYGIDLSLNFSSQSIAGHVDYQIKSLISNLNSVDLDLVDQLIVDSVKVNNQISAYSHSFYLLSITLPQSIALNEDFLMTVYYHGQPYSGYGYTDGGMGFDNNHVGNQVCWTSTEPWGSRNWWPCKDTPSDKAESLDVIIEYPDNYDLASNGVIVAEESLGGGRKRTHYHSNYPIVTYLVAISCANFIVDIQTWNWNDISMPVYSYTFPNAGESRTMFANNTIPMLNHYSNAFGAYPFHEERLANANCGVYGTMEHQTCSFHDPFSYYDQLYLLIHENGHQWWGDMITCKTFNHIWLNEGLTTWIEGIYYEGEWGSQAYHDHMQTTKYMGAGTIYVENVLTDVIFDGSLSYNKGSWVPHMLRGVLGDSLFFETMRAWYNSEFQYSVATTEDFTDVISTAVGEDMSWFINQWIYGDGHPDYQISWLCESDAATGYNLHYFIEQTQPETVFKMPIQIRILTTGGTVDTTLMNDLGRFQGYTISLPDSVISIETDPMQWILRSVTNVPLSMHISTRDLPDAFLETSYYQQLQTIGGIPPYSWVMLGGDIPYGLTWEGGNSAVISGTATYPATYYFTIQVTDSDTPPESEIWNYALTVNEAVPPAVAGDADGSGAVDISDAVFIINYIFGGGPAPDPTEAADADCSSAVDISDAVYLITFIFGGGPEPCLLAF